MQDEHGEMQHIKFLSVLGKSLPAKHTKDTKINWIRFCVVLPFSGFVSIRVHSGFNLSQPRSKQLIGQNAQGENGRSFGSQDLCSKGNRNGTGFDGGIHLLCGEIALRPD